MGLVKEALTVTLKKANALTLVVKEDLEKKKKGREQHRHFSKSSCFDPGHSIFKITGFYDYKYQVTAFNERNNLI